MKRPLELVLIEDTPADVRLTRKALEETQVLHRLEVFEDGESALEYLQAAPALPDLILLDLGLPGMSGGEVLATLKSDPHLAVVPVVILTTSVDEADVVSSYMSHGNSYITKPIALERFFQIIRSIHDFWVDTAQLPPRDVRRSS